MITHVQAIRLLDQLTSAYVRAKAGLGTVSLTTDYSLESGETAALRKLSTQLTGGAVTTADGTFTVATGMQDLAVINGMSAVTSVTSKGGVKAHTQIYREVLQNISTLVVGLGIPSVNTLDKFLSYCNTLNLPSTTDGTNLARPGRWNALIDPNTADMVLGALQQTISPANVYGAFLYDTATAYAKGLAYVKFTGGAISDATPNSGDLQFINTNTNNTAILLKDSVASPLLVANSTASMYATGNTYATAAVAGGSVGLNGLKVAGGIPYLRCIARASNMTGTVTVTGVFRRPSDGLLIMSTATLALAGTLTVDKSYKMTPAVANALLLEVTNISIASGTGSGVNTFVVEAHPTSSIANSLYWDGSAWSATDDTLPALSGATGGATRTYPIA